MKGMPVYRRVNCPTDSRSYPQSGGWVDWRIFFFFAQEPNVVPNIEIQTVKTRE